MHMRERADDQLGSEDQQGSAMGGCQWTDTSIGRRYSLVSGLKGPAALAKDVSAVRCRL